MAGPPLGGVEDEADAEFVGGAFEAERYHFFDLWWRGGFDGMGWLRVIGGVARRRRRPGGGSLGGSRGPRSLLN